MDIEKVRDILDKSKISAVDEINILEYIDDLIQIKMEYFKSLDKLDTYENRIDKAIEYIEDYKHEYYYDLVDKKEVLDILRGEDVSNEDIEYQIYKKELDRELKKVNSIEEFLRGEDNDNKTT